MRCMRTLRQKTGGCNTDCCQQDKPVEMLEEAYAYGCRYFGENKVQELDEKYDIMPKDIHWQMIGHLPAQQSKIYHR